MTAATVSVRDRRPRWSYPYAPTALQAEAHRQLVDELLFGGAAGPGKTEWLVAEHVRLALEVAGSASLILRRTFPELNAAGGIAYRLLERLSPDVATYNRSEHVWTFRNGSLIVLSHAQNENDVLRHQGAEYQLIGFDELTSFTEWQYRYLGSRLRAAGELAARMRAAGYRPRRLATTNPGGPGHAWVKDRFVDPVPPRTRFRAAPTLDEPNPGVRVFVPGLLEDNPHVDDAYRQQLEQLDDDDRRALLYGDWDVYKGQRFRSFRRSVHVVEPEEMPVPLGGAQRGVGVDYGLDAPFAALWGARLADGLVVVYRELYAAGLTPTQQAEAVRAAERPGERSPGRPVPVWLDPSTWARQPHQPTVKGTAGNPPPGSIAGDYAKAKLPPLRANNDRLRGVALVADKLKVRADGRPRLIVYSSCTNLVRTLPQLPRSKLNPEDVDTRAEDHAYDALRYLLAGLEGMPRRGDRAAQPKGRGGQPDRVGSVTGDLSRQKF